MHICTCVHEKEKLELTLLHKKCQHELWKGICLGCGDLRVIQKELPCTVEFILKWKGNSSVPLEGKYYLNSLVLREPLQQCFCRNKFSGYCQETNPPQKYHTAFQSLRTIENPWLKRKQLTETCICKCESMTSVCAVAHSFMPC